MMKKWYYDIKVILSDKTVVFFTVIFPMFLILIIHNLVLGLSDFKFKIGVDQVRDSDSQIIEYVQVKDYEEALQKNEIQIYSKDNKIYTIGYKTGQAYMIENINYMIQQGTKNYTKVETLPRVSDYIALLTMNAFYSIFLTITVMQKYFGKSGIAARISVSNQKIKLMLRSLILCFIFQSFALIMPISYLSYHKLIELNLELFLYCGLLILNGIGIGMLIISFEKLTLGMKQGIATTMAQIMTLIGGGFGIPIMAYYSKYKFPLLQYFSPIHLVNQLLIKGVDYYYIFFLILIPIVTISYAYYNGGKK